MARVVLSVGCTIALFPAWPHVQVEEADIGLICLWMLAELAFGATIGLAVAFLAEALTFGAQVIGLQAGYGYASVVDPTTQAESDVLPVMAQLIAGLLFFTTGLHRLIIRAFAESVSRYPPGSFSISKGLVGAVTTLAAGMFSIGLRLALPILGLLFMADISLALVGRVNSQLHLGMHAFPVKMLIALFVLSLVVALCPALYQSYAADALRTIHRNLLP